MRAMNRNSRVAGAVLLTLLLAAGGADAADDPGLVDAARSQDSTKVRALIDRKADVNMRSADGSTALLWAAHWNDVASAELLLRAHADANIANERIQIVLHQLPELPVNRDTGQARIARLL